MNSSVSRKIIRVIPNKIFFELWKNTSEDKEIYLKTSGKLYNKKWNIPLDHYLDLLNYIYERANTSVLDIISQSGMSKASVSYALCIPRNTLDNWCTGIRPCPGYIKLMMLRYFGMIKLPHHIYIESEIPAEKNTSSKGTEEQVLISKENYNNFKYWEQEHIHKEKSDAEALLERLSYLDKYIKK